MTYYTHKMEQYAWRYDAMNRATFCQIFRDLEEIRVNLQSARISRIAWEVAGVGGGSDPPTPRTKRRPRSRISSSRTPPSRVDFHGGIIPPSPCYLNIIMPCSSHHISAFVAPFRACNMSNCSSQRVLHFIPLHHVHFRSS